MILGNKLIGSGASKVIVLHDWWSDRTSYETTLPFLNQDDFRFAFFDLRGYGDSIDLKGEYSLQEASEDILNTADHIGWKDFHLVGYSMTGLVVQNVAALAPKRVLSITCVCSVPANGFADVDAAFLQFMTDAARDDDEKALQLAGMLTGNRHDKNWSAFKVRRWRETSVAAARLGYLSMFTHSNIVDKVNGTTIPTHVICTSDDIEGLRRDAINSTFGKWYRNLTVSEINNAGHCPMQETPASFATTVNRYLESRLPVASGA